MDTEMGIAWKAKIEKMYSELAEMEVGFFPPEEEAKIEQGFDEVRAAKRDFRREARRALAKQRQLEAGEDQTTEVTDKRKRYLLLLLQLEPELLYLSLNGKYDCMIANFSICNDHHLKLFKDFSVSYRTQDVDFLRR